MMSATRDRTSPLDGAVLVRISTAETGWFRALPSTPDGQRIGITLSRSQPRSATDELRRRGYEPVGVVAGRSERAHADVLVPAELRTGAARWYASLLLPALRVFDLRFGPVHVALRAELDAHLAALESLRSTSPRMLGTLHLPAEEDHR